MVCSVTNSRPLLESKESYWNITDVFQHVMGSDKDHSNAIIFSPNFKTKTQA